MPAGVFIANSAMLFAVFYPQNQFWRNQSMQALVVISSIYALFMALVGFLFGQLFAGHFEVGATLAGVFGAAAAVLGVVNLVKSSAAGPSSDTLRRATVGCALTALLGVALDAANYYLYLNITGNYYAWFMIGPFCAALALIATLSWRGKP
jgi:predicted Co/Zn/Cd cation transporter (cation efflux family)